MMTTHGTSLPCSLIAFDFDGTLADTYPWFQSVLHQVADQYGFRKPEPSETDALRQLDARGVLKSLEIPLWKAPSILSHVRRKMQDAAPDIVVFEGMIPVLHTLKAYGVTLALVSSNAESNVRRILGPEPASLFNVLACGTDLFGKSSKLKHVLRETGCEARHAILIGDEIRDIDAAHAIGMQAGAVCWGYNHPSALRAHAPDMIFDTPADISRWHADALSAYTD